MNLLPRTYQDEKRQLSEVSRIVNDLIYGRNNAVGTATLGTGTSTTVTDDRAGADRFIGLTSLVVDTGCFLVSQTNGSFVIGHSSGMSGKQVRYVILG